MTASLASQPAGQPGQAMPASQPGQPASQASQASQEASQGLTEALPGPSRASPGPHQGLTEALTGPHRALQPASQPARPAWPAWPGQPWSYPILSLADVGGRLARAWTGAAAEAAAPLAARAGSLGEQPGRAEPHGQLRGARTWREYPVYHSQCTVPGVPVAGYTRYCTLGWVHRVLPPRTDAAQLSVGLSVALPGCRRAVKA